MIDSISVIIASAGRPTLADVVNDVTPQLAAGDELLVDVNVDSPFGHKARNRMITKAKPENVLVFYDDDDIVMADALSRIRRDLWSDPDTMHVYRMVYGPFDSSQGRKYGTFTAHILFEDRQIKLGNVSTQMVAVPGALARLSRFGDRYEGDYDFIHGVEQACHALNRPVAYHDCVVAIHNGRR